MTQNELLKTSSRFPFTIYDVFGYLIPGSAFIFICIIFDVWIFNNASAVYSLHTPFLTVGKTLFYPDILNNVTLSLILLLMGAIVAYVSGHIIASVSAFSIDRLLIGRGYYYPFVTLTAQSNDLKIDGEKNRIRGGFALFNLILMVFATIFSTDGIYNIINYSTKLFILSIFILSAIILFFYTTGRSSKVRFPINICAKLYNYITSRLSYFTRTSDSLPQVIINKFKSFTKKEFGDDEYKNSDTYWFCYMYVINNSHSFFNHLSNWLHLYSYARNLSTSLYLASIYILIIITVNNLNGVLIDPISYLLFPIVFGSSFIMLTRFYYLYVSYYTKFLIRACIFINENVKNE